MSVRQYEQVFYSMDKDKSGYLDYSEMEKLLSKTQAPASKKELFRTMDMDGDNKITLTEFLQTLGIGTPEEIKEVQLRGCFRAFDKDDSGTIDKHEVGAVFKEIGKTMTDADLTRCQQLMDADGDGQVNYEEFILFFFGKK